MFGGVNSNIRIRSISSKIRESDRILNEFEQDSEEGTLKLLYAVDMLNEGYHIKDLDGVIMMRPTFSPTIYTQQLGRALSVGENKNPVVLDLVNNFDSCKIIEDFAERMKKYKGTYEAEIIPNDRKRGISIFDKTKEFREIVEKITGLSKRNKVSIEQKIEIIERFMQTGEDLVSSTIFEGYPIGQWATQIRSGVKRMNDGQKDSIIINLTEEQLEKLKSMGILESRVDSTIDEKIDSLIEWRRKYPKLKIVPLQTDDALRESVETDEEYSQIREEYQKIQRYYEYVRTRRSNGKLNEEQISRCIEGDVGGVFGTSTRVKELTKELVEKYAIAKKDAEYISAKYGTLDNFYEAYTEEKMDSEDVKLAEAIIRNIIDIDGNPNRNYENLIREFGSSTTIRQPKGKEILIYSSKKLKELIEELNPKEKYVIEGRFGLGDDTLPKTFREIGDEMNLSGSSVQHRVVKALRKLREKSEQKKLFMDFSFDDKYMTDEEKKQIDIIRRDIQLQNGDFTENLEKGKQIQEKINARRVEEGQISKEKQKEKQKERLKKDGIGSGQLNVEELASFTYEDLLEIGLEAEVAAEFSSKIEKYKTRKEEKERLQLKNLDLSVRAYNCLKRAGIESLADLSNMTAKELMKVRNLGKDVYSQIVAKMSEYGISFREEGQEEPLKPSEIKTIEDLGLPIRAYNCLKRAGIRSVEDLSNMTAQQLMEVRNLGKNSYNQIVAKMSEYEIPFKEEDEKQDTEKSRLVQRVLTQQQTIEAQQEEIKRLSKTIGEQEQ